MSDNELLDPILPSLVDTFEAHKGRCMEIEAASPEEWEPLRQLFARQYADGLMVYTGSKSWLVALTPKGYATHLPRVTARRKLSGLENGGL